MGRITNLDDVIGKESADILRDKYGAVDWAAIDDSWGYDDDSDDYLDKVNHPPHYTHLPVEAIEITEHFNFCMGNALKYIIRADHKGKPIEDLRKAVWYLNREIERRLDADVQL